jgi:predicted membrane-bound dolichyl-phosphate-mannose-protein mannosyltransferase
VYPLFKIIIIVALIAVVVALFTALVFLYRDRGRGERMVAALAVRVILSAALIGFLVLAYRMGWITPGGVR